jgi:hypothetical protein
MKVVNIGKLDGSRIMIVAQDSDGMFWIEAAASKIVS